jgi:hypothetical protein
VANIFRLGQNGEKETPILEGNVDGMITSLYLVDKPGEVHKGRPICGLVKIKGNIPERWGRNPSHESVQKHARASVVEIC